MYTQPRGGLIVKKNSGIQVYERRRYTVRVRRRNLILAVLVVGVLGLLLARPSDRGGSHSEDFEKLSQVIDVHAPGQNLAVLDLAILEHNAARIRAEVAPEISIRLVGKSLPSIPLLRHLMQRLATDRLMVFSEPFLHATLAELPGTDILLGKPLPAVAAERVLTAHPSAAEDVCWLVDTQARVLAYGRIASKLDQTLRICIELDVGLRRGGANQQTLPAMLDAVATVPALRFAGFMGYDGHVPHAPPLLASSDGEFAAVHLRYQALVDLARAHQPTLLSDTTIYDSGGSLTYWRYSGERPPSPVNEISVGSAFLAPKAFTAVRERGLERAVVLAAPVLKRAPTTLPFAGWAASALSIWDRNLAVHFFLQGGSWPADPISPPGLQPHFMWDSDPPVRNLLPNQPLLTGSTSVELDVGDWVFFDPWEGDAMVSVPIVLAVRDGDAEQWPTYRGGN